MNIILIKNEEEADYLSKEYEIMKVVYDIGGSLTKLQISLKAGAEQQQRYNKCSDLSKKECELK
jgi:hypothetical protein